jgi:NhaP-type Na+/H+ or K+/H+ antiporter
VSAQILHALMCAKIATRRVQRESSSMHYYLKRVFEVAAFVASLVVFVYLYLVQSTPLLPVGQN